MGLGKSRASDVIVIRDYSTKLFSIAIPADSESIILLSVDIPMRAHLESLAALIEHVTKITKTGICLGYI